MAGFHLFGLELEWTSSILAVQELLMIGIIPHTELRELEEASASVQGCFNHFSNLQTCHVSFPYWLL